MKAADIDEEPQIKECLYSGLKTKEASQNP